MSETIRCGVVGVGYLGRFHAQKYELCSEAELIGVCDLDEKRGQEVAKEVATKYFATAEELIAAGVEAVTIASSTESHYEMSRQFLAAGIHVHVEKPMTTTSIEGEELCRMAKEKSLILQVGHVERFNPALIAAQEKLNKPLFIECHRLAPFKKRSVDVNVVLDLMIHDLDVVLSLVKSEPISVAAIGTPVLTKEIDIANARVEFASGAVVNLTASRVSMNSQRKFRVFQDSQYLSIDFGAGELNLLGKVGDWETNEMPIESEAWRLDKGDALLAETQSFLGAVAKKHDCVVTGQDGLIALRLAEQIIDGINQRRA